MNITARKSFATQAAADTWRGSFPRTETVTVNGETVEVTWKSGKVETYGSDVFIAEIRTAE